MPLYVNKTKPQTIVRDFENLNVMSETDELKRQFRDTYLVGTENSTVLHLLVDFLSFRRLFKVLLVITY